MPEAGPKRSLTDSAILRYQNCCRFVAPNRERGLQPVGELNISSGLWRRLVFASGVSWGRIKIKLVVTEEVICSSEFRKI
jgi:hypothetical protein